jgi:hypothetical protein
MMVRTIEEPAGVVHMGFHGGTRIVDAIPVANRDGTKSGELLFDKHLPS